MPTKILLTGATGYIGGTILSTLLESPSPSLHDTTITCLIRDNSDSNRAAILAATYGSRINPVLYSDLDDLETATSIAAQHDLVINAAPGYHGASAKALLQGLSQRKEATGRDVWMVHTSGTSNIADQPYSRMWIDEDPEREFDDARDDIYGYEKTREAKHWYPQREAELAVVDTGVELGVKTVVVMSPTIFGIGTGLFNRASHQIPGYTKCALDRGRAVVVGEGKGVWDHVHVEDVAELYGVVVLAILEKGGAGVPTGKNGIIFSGNGRHSWMDVAQGVADACYEAGKIPERQVESLSLEDGAKILAPWVGPPDFRVVELALSSNSRTVASVGKKLGWVPKRGEQAWRRAFREDLEMVQKTKLQRWVPPPSFIELISKMAQVAPQ